MVTLALIAWPQGQDTSVYWPEAIRIMVDALLLEPSIKGRFLERTARRLEDAGRIEEAAEARGAAAAQWKMLGLVKIVSNGPPVAVILFMAKKLVGKTYPVNVDDKPGPETAGQSGDTQGLSNEPEADSESVEELVEEGQFFEAAVVSGVENAPDADEGPVRTREVREDDVPDEYRTPD